MEEQQNLWQFMAQQSDKIGEQVLAHTGLTFLSLLLSVLVGLPLGILIARRHTLAGAVLGVAGVLQTIPSIALLGFLIPMLGIGALPAIAALFLYALLPIIRNTYTGIRQVDPSVVDAAFGMGMTPGQVLCRVQLPLAMPVILAGIRTATVINVGVATLAAYIAAGGLGEFIFGGIALNNPNMILAGAIPAAMLALLFDFLLSQLQRLGVRRWRKNLLVLPLLLLLFSSFYLVPAGSQRLRAGFEAEFMGRRDGYLGLKATYGLHLPSVVINDAVMYEALYQEKLDVIGGYSTDGRLKAFDLVALEDDKTIFPPYYAAPLVRREALEKFPELATTLNLLAGKINDSTMTALNYKVDYLKQLPERVAKDFLVANGLFRLPQGKRKGIVRLGSKVFGEQYILVQLYRQLLEGYTSLQVETKTGLGGTKICFDALLHNQIDLYPEYTGTGLLVILKTPATTVDSLIQNRDLVYRYVNDKFATDFALAWLSPIGFNNTYALMMRKRQAKQLGIKTISDLKRFTDGD